MQESADIADVRYGVLEVPRIEGGSEPFLVAYPNEDCLYDVIAASRIVAHGLSSREAVIAAAEPTAMRVKGSTTSRGNQ